MSGRENLALKQPVREALQRLEHANPVLQVTSAEMGSSWRITTEGEQAVGVDDIADKRAGQQAEAQHDPLFL